MAPASYLKNYDKNFLFLRYYFLLNVLNIFFILLQIAIHFEIVFKTENNKKKIFDSFFRPYDAS
jgi:threonine synthase